MRLSLPSLVVTLSLALATTVPAQTPADPSGHWEGEISAPGGEISFQVDLFRNANGQLLATYSRPDNNLVGYPLSNVTMTGTSIRFELRANGTTTFEGALLTNGTVISGDVSSPIGGAPFTMGRTGDARIQAPPRNSSIARELEGTWNGTLSAQGQSLRLVLRMANVPDGTATGTITIVDQGGVELPLALTQKSGTLTLTLNSPAVGGDFFSGTVNAAGTVLTGTFSQGQLSLPLLFEQAQ